MKGSLAKREEWYPDITSGSASETSPIAASASLVAVSWAATGGGSIGVIPVSLKGKRTSSSPQIPIIRAHSAQVGLLLFVDSPYFNENIQVTDLAFSPFSDTLLASGSEDCSIRLWDIHVNASTVEESSIATPASTYYQIVKILENIK